MLRLRNNNSPGRLLCRVARAAGAGGAALFFAFRVCAQDQDVAEDAARDSAVAGVALNEEAPETSAAAPEKTFRRDPFWPVGYSPPAQGRLVAAGSGEKPVERKTSEKEWDDAVKALVYQGGLVSAGAVYAIINGQMCQEGDVLSVKRGGKTFRFRIKSLAPGKAHLERLREAPAGQAGTGL